jgi:hypothetical protein
MASILKEARMLRSARRRRLAWLVAFLLALLESCASTSLVSSQRDRAYVGPPLKQLIVMGVSSDQRVRKAFEDEFVAKLKAAGVSAQPSYPLIPDTSSVDKAQLQEVVEKAGADGILAARLVQVETTSTGLQAFNFQDRSAGFYAYYSSYSPEPIGLSDSTLAGGPNPITIHFDLYSVAGSQLAWAGDAATFPSTDVQQVTAGLAYTVIPALKKQKLI